MKKTMTTLAIAGLCAMSAGAFAASNPQANVQWFGTVPGVIPGSDLTITGANGQEILDGVLMIENNGSFVSQDKVTLEAHAYTPEDVDAGTPAVIGDLVDAKWSLENVSVIPGSYNSDNIKVSFNNQEVAVNSELPTAEDVVYLTVKHDSENTDVTPGEQVRVTTTIMAKAAA
ncbi:hypothetical protein [Photobacterium damselae]|uniref:Uncharacterized protein n=1 Tax=Photobacterium damselae subsp. damselae TaxID=85581 RepID=A0AAD3WZT2_PHODD|nr:hypothetical protein [Photobacterium damselae]KAB1182438.1 hypothetical protein F6450_06910 [Photobacterium damselae subsp. damselae]